MVIFPIFALQGQFYVQHGPQFISIYIFFSFRGSFGQLAYYVLHRFQGKSKKSPRLACFLAYFVLVCIKFEWLLVISCGALHLVIYFRPYQMRLSLSWIDLAC